MPCLLHPQSGRARADGRSSLSAPTPGTGIVRNPLLSDRDACLHVHPWALSSPGAERSGSLPASRRLVGTGGHQCPLGASGSPWRPVPATAPMLSLLSVLPGMKVGSYTADLLIQPPTQALSPHPGMVGPGSSSWLTSAICWPLVKMHRRRVIFQSSTCFCFLLRTRCHLSCSLGKSCLADPILNLGRP